MTKKRTLRVLIVDDNSNLRDLLEEGVLDWGYDVGTACSGEEALECLAVDKYNVVVCDLKMPGMGGLRLLREIKLLDKMIQVIIITGYATLETAVKAMEAGAYEYLTKPFQLDELMAVMENVSKRMNNTGESATFHERLNNTHGELEVMRALQRSRAEEPSE